MAVQLCGKSSKHAGMNGSKVETRMFGQETCRSDPSPSILVQLRDLGPAHDRERLQSHNPADRSLRSNTLMISDVSRPFKPGTALQPVVFLRWALICLVLQQHLGSDDRVSDGNWRLKIRYFQMEILTKRYFTLSLSRSLGHSSQSTLWCETGDKASRLSACQMTQKARVKESLAVSATANVEMRQTDPQGQKRRKPEGQHGP